jgi:hypothetical protein
MRLVRLVSFFGLHPPSPCLQHGALLAESHCPPSDVKLLLSVVFSANLAALAVETQEWSRAAWDLAHGSLLAAGRCLRPISAGDAVALHRVKVAAASAHGSRAPRPDNSMVCRCE